MSEAFIRFPPEAVSFACSRCGARQVATVRTILDTREQGSREAVLGGRFHQAVCTRCGTANRVPSPFLFHDAATDSAFILALGLGAPRDVEEQAIGRLTNKVLESLPLEERRMYLLSPRSFLTDSSFIDAVLATTGMTPEMLDAARARARLVEQLLRANEAGAREALLVQSGEDPRDVSEVAAAMAEHARSIDDAYRAESLERLARSLAAPSERQPSPDELIAALDEARTEGVLDDATAALRPFLDYAFFAAMTALMEAAVDDEATRLRILRKDVLDSLDRTDAASQAELEASVATLRAALEASDPATALRAQPNALTPSFFFVLAANIRAAREQGSAVVADRLEKLHEAAVEIVEDSLPPSQRLINQLARTQDGQQRLRLVADGGRLLDAELIAELRGAAHEARAAGATVIAENLDAAIRIVDEQNSPAVAGP